MWYEQITYISPKVVTDNQGLVFKDKVVPQGAQIKFRYRRGIFLFGTVATNTETGSTWIDCREYSSRKVGKWRAFPLDTFKEQVLPKKRRVKRVR